MSGALVIGLAGVSILGAAGALIMAFRSPVDEDDADEERQAPDVQQPEPGEADPSPLITRSLERLSLQKRLQWSLLQAGLLVRPSELVALMLGVGFVGFVIGAALMGSYLGLAMGVAAMSVPFAYVAYRKGARRRAMAAQLADALGMMASSMRSGYSFLRAMQIVRDEMDPPIADEFGRALDELSVGVPQERALSHLHDRCPTGDIELVVTACQIQSNVGGNLAEILDTTAGMIRERVRLQGEIAALTAEGRLSAGILAALPVFLAVVVDQLSPGYLLPLINTKVGLVMFGGASSAMLLGLFVIKKLLAIEI